MIDLSLLRDPRSAEAVRESERKRGRGTTLVDEVISMVEERIKMRFELEQHNKTFNALTKEAMACFKEKRGSDEAREYARKISELKEAKTRCKARLDEMENEAERKAAAIGNIVDPRVFVSSNEDENPLVEMKELPRKEFSPESMMPFEDVLERLGAVDTHRGTKIAGHRGYFLKDAGVLLAQSLVRYGMDFLRKRGYTLMQTPFIMDKSVMAKTAQLSDFDDQLYKVEGDMYLIATSEQPISAYHSEEWLGEGDVPIKYCGYSSCFRKEAGAHGKDNRGIFRVHQFEKIEQFIICAPEESHKHFEDMINTSKEFYDSLGLGYRVMSIVSGALNDAASIKYDLEALFPASERYRELVSCSNCLDYQSRGLGVRLGIRETKQSAKRYVHMLNGTLCAVQRTLCCLAENYQSSKGLVIPDVLVPYLGETFLPYKE
jgi:seryl-tRNA synthetase